MNFYTCPPKKIKKLALLNVQPSSSVQKKRLLLALLFTLKLLAECPPKRKPIAVKLCSHTRFKKIPQQTLGFNAFGS
ncbi:MAG: hypothetical protein EAY75_00225 [Bacteroidetes bacterium]|nr:MAG: hypothetical protein EAY75_00225 [Bacteroidota bacterium]